jgi:hypothetical protein
VGFFTDSYDVSFQWLLTVYHVAMLMLGSSDLRHQLDHGHVRCCFLWWNH